MPKYAKFTFGFNSPQLSVLGVESTWNGIKSVTPLPEPDLDRIIEKLNATEPKPKPSPKYRPWRATEVPVGAPIRFRDQLGTRLISNCTPDGQVMILGVGGVYDTESLLCQCIHSLDHGKTWHPCGVEVKP